MKSDGTSPPTKTAESIDDLVDRCEAARVLGIAIRTLDRWNRHAGQIRYRLSSLARWVLSHETVPQSRAVSEASQDSRPFSQTPAKISTQAKDTPSGSASGVDDAPNGPAADEGEHVQY